MTEVRTIVDPRVVDESGVVMNQYVGPLNWEHYKIPASGLSDTQITFANIVTLGTNRIYDSNFQVEYTVQIDFTGTSFAADIADNPDSLPIASQRIKFNPFPLHWVSDQVRVNVNGSACMSRPQESLLQRMLFWRQSVIDKTCSFCPHTKPPMGAEPYVRLEGLPVAPMLRNKAKYDRSVGKLYDTELPCVSFNYNPTTHIASITCREPVLCPPFNQRLDKLYQRPLFNITSIDMVYQLNDLRKMLIPMGRSEIEHGTHATAVLSTHVYALDQIQVHISDAQLCFNVASMPPGMVVPPIMTMPYYDNVCYVTQAPSPINSSNLELTSGVYTLAQVPTAIYVFVGPNQLARSTVIDSIPNPSGTGTYINTLTENFFCPIKNINITMGNNTQLLNTTTEYDRYQMALANGLQDCTWEEFSKPFIPSYACYQDNGKANEWVTPTSDAYKFYMACGHGNRCCLRLIPGIDLLIPDRRLVGGMDADQMVFQVKVNVDTTGVPPYLLNYLSLWLMFEYCGVLTIEPVHATIDMIPIKSLPPITKVDAVADSTVAPSGEDAAGFGGGEGTANPEGAGMFGGGPILSFLTSKLPSLVMRGLRKIVDWADSPTARAARQVVTDIVRPGDERNAYMRPGDDALMGRFAPYFYGRMNMAGYNAPMSGTSMGTDSNVPLLMPPPEKKVGGTIIGSGTLGKFYT